MNEEIFYKEIGQRIYKARKKAELTQEALASLVSLSRTSLTNIEKGRQKMLLHTFVEIADKLKVTPDSLLPETSITTVDKELNQLLKGRPRKTQEWVKSTMKSIKEES